jgi:hypothetical protein
MAFFLQQFGSRELARFGNVRTKTLKVFSLEAFGEWVKNLPEEED